MIRRICISDYRYNVMPVSIQQAAPYSTYWENSRGKGCTAALCITS